MKSAKTKSAKNEGESQRKMTDWLISSSRNGRKVTFFEKIEVCEFYNSETQRLVQNVILKLEKIRMVLVKPTMVKHPLRKIGQTLWRLCPRHVRDVSVIDP